MKYFKTKFVINSLDGKPLDTELLSTSRELCSALAGYAGYESFEDTPDGVCGYVQQEQFDESTLKMSLLEFPIDNVKVEYSTTEAEDKNWNEEWEKSGFEPIVVGKKCLIHDLYHPADGGAVYPIDVEIDAKQAFGTGTHNTTRMIVNKLLEMSLTGKQVLDCGCGTGILSIVASKCGAGSITAYDIDEWSVENTRHNAAINHVDNITVLHGDSKILDTVTESFDVVLANINRNILLSDMPTMTSKLKSGALLILSGFYADDKPLLKEKAESLGLKCDGEDSSDNWAMLAFRN